MAESSKVVTNGKMEKNVGRSRSISNKIPTKDSIQFQILWQTDLADKDNQAPYAKNHQPGLPCQQYFMDFVNNTG